MDESNRSLFFLDSFHRGERDIRERMTRLREHPFVFWPSWILGGALGLSLLTFWPFVGLPWWIGLIVLALGICAIGVEGAFRTWREQKLALESGAHYQIRGRGIGTQLSRPLADVPNAFFVSDTVAHREGHVIRITQNTGAPKAVLFKTPRHEKFVRAADTPCVIEVRRGLRRLRIVVQSFVAGGIVVDDTGIPRRSGVTDIDVVLYFEEAS